MNYYEVAPNQIIRPGSDTFTYCSTDKLQIGQIVLIEVGKKQVIGVITSQTKKPIYATKPIAKTIEDTPIPKQLIDLSIWLARYYTTPLATVLQTILPRGIQKKRNSKENILKVTKRDRINIVFNSDQTRAINTLKTSKPGTFLLQGITGSGKTEVYIAAAKLAFSDGKSAIILVPEIALTPQLVSEFSNHFEDLLVTHSKMTESNRHKIWDEALKSQKPRIVIGPRSALFMPLSDIGLIIVDEAHEPSYKQEQSPRYSALRAATMLGRFHGAKVVFGSATPNVIDRYLAEQSNNPILVLNKVAREGSQVPSIQLVDMTKRSNFNGHRFFSKQLIEQIEKTLADKKQTLIFHNRRGSASSTLCRDCSWFAACPRCFLPLTLHADKHILLCHICGYQTSVPTSCPDCHGADIIFKGIGTKLIESELKKLFPKANIARFDADNKTDDTINNRYEELYNGMIDIAIGTQIVAKGLDLPHLRTVGIIQADSGLSLPDFNANERTFQLLSQVIGRVGRNEHQTNVIVQSFQPTHPSVVNGIKQNYEAFYKQTLIERQHSKFPPFTHLLKLDCSYKTESAAIKNAQSLAAELKTKLHKSVQVLGPTPAFYERQHGTYHWQLVLKSPKREYLIDAMKFVPQTHWQSELDPTSLL
ncbi:MAG: primosomal protein N' [Candidatus Saccharibacteria bacterium]